MEQVTFSEFYSLMDIAGIIIVEDTIEFDLSRKAIMYDYLMLIDNDKNRIIDKEKYICMQMMKMDRSEDLSVGNAD